MHHGALERDIAVFVPSAVFIDKGVAFVAVDFQLALVNADKFFEQVEAEASGDATHAGAVAPLKGPLHASRTRHLRNKLLVNMLAKKGPDIGRNAPTEIDR